MCVFSHWVISDSVQPHGQKSLVGYGPWGFSQAWILEWVAISFSGGSSWPRDRIRISCIDGQILYHWAMWEAQIVPGSQV